MAGGFEISGEKTFSNDWISLDDKHGMAKDKDNIS